MSRRGLERRLQGLDGFAEPRVELEQYPTPAELAAHVIHLAALQGDLAGRTVVDLGTGTGVLALGAALDDPARVVGLDLDTAALEVARANERSLAPATRVDWVHGDATAVPLRPAGTVTVVMNPPFGAQRSNVHADRGFLETAAAIASVSYSIHNRGSRAFVEAFAADSGGRVTHAVEGILTLDRQFPFHTEPSRELPVEVFRIEWGR